MSTSQLNNLMGMQYTHPYDDPSAPCTRTEKKTSTTIAPASFVALAKIITMSPSNRRTVDCQPNRPLIPDKREDGICQYNPHTIRGDSECLRESLLTPFSIASVTDITTQTSRKEIHPSKDGSNRGGSLGSQTKLLFKVKSGCVVHGDFDAKAACVLDKDEPRVDIQYALLVRLPDIDVTHLILLFEFRVVALRRVICKLDDAKGCNQANGCRKHTYRTPCLVGIAVVNVFKERKQDGSHDNLSDTTSKVTPSTDGSIGCSNPLSCEHCTRPVS